MKLVTQQIDIRSIGSTANNSFVTLKENKIGWKNQDIIPE